MGESRGDTADAADGLTPLPALAEAAVYTALRSWLVAVLPTGVAVVRARGNRVAPPPLPFALLSMTTQEKLATPAWRYTATTREVTQPMLVGVEVALFGPEAGSLAARVVALWQDMQAADYFAALGQSIAPLYAADPHQSPYVSGEHQYEECWQAELTMQVGYGFSLPQDFATTLPLRSIGADFIYPPEE